MHCTNCYNTNNSIYDLQKETRRDKILSKILQYFNEDRLKSDCVDNNVKLYFNMRNDILANEDVIYYQ